MSTHLDILTAAFRGHYSEEAARDYAGVLNLRMKQLARKKRVHGHLSEESTTTSSAINTNVKEGFVALVIIAGLIGPYLF